MATSRQASFRTARWIGVLALVGCPPEYEVIDDFEVDSGGGVALRLLAGLGDEAVDL